MSVVERGPHCIVNVKEVVEVCENPPSIVIFG